ncbi:MAG: IclR family transcriptional regulator [Actinobacteria bacterium]|nr:IclR family transcriptional regulator [Actinomycetota bacterium]
MIRVVDRIGQILGAFSLEQPELTLTECARAIDLNKSSTYRLLQSLEAIGLVDRDDYSWRLGPRTVTLATIRLGRFELRREAISQLRALRTKFREAVAFSVPEGSEMIYLERLDSPEAYGVSARLGSRAAMWAGGSGKATLARFAPSEREGRLDVDEWHRLPKTVQDRVLAEVTAAAERGYCVDGGEFFNGIGGVATAITNAHGEPIAAVSVIVPNERLDDDYVRALGTQLMKVREQLEIAVGARPWREADQAVGDGTKTNADG